MQIVRLISFSFNNEFFQIIGGTYKIIFETRHLVEFQAVVLNSNLWHSFNAGVTNNTFLFNIDVSFKSE